MDTSDWAYIAGIVDGEGCIDDHISNYRYHYPRLQITNTNREVLEYIQNLLGGRIGLHYAASTKVGNTGYMCKKDVYRWTIVGSAAKPVLLRLRPFLRIKGCKTDEVLVATATLISRRKTNGRKNPYE